MSALKVETIDHSLELGQCQLILVSKAGMVWVVTGKHLFRTQQGLQLSLWLATAQIGTGWVCEPSFNKLFEVWGYLLSVFIIPALGITRMKNSVYFKLFPLKDQWCFYFPTLCVHNQSYALSKTLPKQNPQTTLHPPQHEVCTKSKSPWLSSFSSTKFGGRG